MSMSKVKEYAVIALVAAVTIAIIWRVQKVKTVVLGTTA